MQYIRTDTITAPEVNLASRYYGRFTKSSSTGKLIISQSIEGVNAANVHGRTVRVQIKMRGLVAASALWNVGLVQNTGLVDDTHGVFFVSAYNADGIDPTLTANFAYIPPNGAFPAEGGVIVGNKIQAAITNSPTWVRVGGCFDVPDTAKNLLVVIWSDSGVVATNGIALGEACLADSTAIQDWEPLEISLELVRVQRFFCKSFNVDQQPTNNVTTRGRVVGWVNAAGATAGQLLPIRLPVTMRSNTSDVTFYSVSGGTAGQVENLITGTAATGTAVSGVFFSENGGEVTCTGEASWAVGQPIAVHFTANANI